MERITLFSVAFSFICFINDRVVSGGRLHHISLSYEGAQKSVCRFQAFVAKYNVIF